MNPEDLTEKSHVALRVAAGLNVSCALIVPAAAVTRRDVEIVIVATAWTEPDPTPIMIGLRMIESEQDSFVCRISDLWVLC